MTFDIIFSYLLHYSVILAWGLNIFFLAGFARQWHAREPDKPRAWLALAAVAVPAVAITFFLPARSGYDNNHGFMCLATEFFTTTPGALLSFKEVSPLFTDGITDLVSGNSIAAILWKNRLLPALSVFVFFTGLRRLGAGITLSAAGSAFFLLNFLSLLAASSFSTTSANIFIWLVSLLALFDAYAAKAAGARSLAWIMSSLVLVISARFEFLPVNLLLLTALLLVNRIAHKTRTFKTLPVIVLAAGVCFIALWGAHILKHYNPGQVGSGLFPLISFIYQLGTLNLAIIAHGGQTIAEHYATSRNLRVLGLAATPAALIGFLIFTLPGVGIFIRAALKKTAKGALAAPAILTLWIIYFSTIFVPLSQYSLHFIRHQLYFFLPFAYLFILALAGFESAVARLPGRRATLFYALCWAGIAAYAALNARAALAFNGELRTDDRELAFLMEAQRAWPPGCLAAYTPRPHTPYHFGLLQKHFPLIQDSSQTENRCLLKYVSAATEILPYAWESPLTQVPLPAGAPGTAWRAVSFKHAFYTTFNAYGAPGSAGAAGERIITEVKESRPLTLGFFNFENGGRDKAFLKTLDGLGAFNAGDYDAAKKSFKAAAAADPGCLRCRYFLAVSCAALGDTAAAGVELKKIARAEPAALTPQHRALISALAEGDEERSLALMQELGSLDPGLFPRADLRGGIDKLNQPRRPAEPSE